MQRKIVSVGCFAALVGLFGWLATHPSSLPNLPEVPVYYRNCDAARDSGVAPIRRGEPGYRPELDADGDGIACEPYFG